MLMDYLQCKDNISDRCIQNKLFTFKCVMLEQSDWILMASKSINYGSCSVAKERPHSKKLTYVK